MAVAGKVKVGLLKFFKFFNNTQIRVRSSYISSGGANSFSSDISEYKMIVRRMKGYMYAVTVVGPMEEKKASVITAKQKISEREYCYPMLIFWYKVAMIKATVKRTMAYKRAQLANLKDEDVGKLLESFAKVHLDKIYPSRRTRLYVTTLG